MFDEVSVCTRTLGAFLSLLIVYPVLTKSALQPSRANKFSSRASNFSLSLVQRAGAYGKLFSIQVIKIKGKTSMPLPQASKTGELLVRGKAGIQIFFEPCIGMASQAKRL